MKLQSLSASPSSAESSLFLSTLRCLCSISRCLRRLTRKMCHQHALDGCANVIAPNSDALVLFGANFLGRGSRKGDRRSIITRKLRRHLARVRKVVLIDEYLTSQVCWKCSHKCCEANSERGPHPFKRSPSGKYNELEPCYARMNKADKDEHRNLYCHKCNCRINRDLNAACNIMSIYRSLVTTGTRPPCLTKPPRVEDLEVASC